MNNRRKILLFTDWYYPGYKAGGPIQSCINIVGLMQGEFDFFVFTSDRDLNDPHTYPGITTGKWLDGMHGEQVFYADKNKLNITAIRSIVARLRPDVVYFNSMFSLAFTIYPRLALKTLRYPGKIILAPRGMLHPGALELKSRKKMIFLRAFRLMGLHKRVLFHATDTQEVMDVQKVFPKAAFILVNNIPSLQEINAVRPPKMPGQLRLVFISRISPKKNLRYLLELLSKYKFPGNISLDVYGAVEDVEYVLECRRLIADLPPNVMVEIKGALPNAEVQRLLHHYHCFVLPTLGENFGHAIFESLYAGRPVLISDKTPWLNLESVRAGWDVPLKQSAVFAEKLKTLLAMDHTEWEVWSYGAKKVAARYMEEGDFKNKYRMLFL
ncbi:glycosyltransferase family 4 protein [Parasegetibacter sp. NRK P23]|uniref:glycosyltransferase family 4 protein n=1 Tax=Parasegetibacter sp. NRK P23 TaxID=2942999 RepID=UPI002044C188|nr:glycosyltransferase family 4 protein [Parasegetibacter sp. NRK P23]MCM5527625.1 glycosyltransferase family 4 protein [Parasegetibacter sp. NRK P23]